MKTRRAMFLQRIKNHLPINSFVIGNGSKNAVERADTQRLVGGNGDTVRSGFLRLQDHVAAYLVDLDVSPVPTECGREFMAAHVTREFHPRASISSRIR
jgi:hypothetical protein